MAENKLHCPQCNKDFKSQQEMDRHRKEVHEKQSSR